MHEMGRVFAENRAFFECLGHEREVHLREVTHAAVDQLRTARTRCLCKVMRFDQRSAIATRRGVHRDAEASCTTANDKHFEFKRFQ